MVQTVRACLASALLVASAALAQEPAACLAAEPNLRPPPSKPYFLVIADTSASMAQPVATTASCGGTTRLDHLRCSLRSLFLGAAGQAHFGLATFATTQTSCGAQCSSTCTYGCFPSETTTRGNCTGCGPRPGNATTSAGAVIRVPIATDNFWSTPPTPSNLTSLLGWVDQSCTANAELYANGLTPLNGALRDARRYFSGTWTSPDGVTTFTSPLAAQDLSGAGVNGSTGCRPVNVILITDGDETCDSQADVVAAAQDLYQNGVVVGGRTFKVRVFVVSFATSSQANANQIAAAGGTTSSYVAANEAGLASALNTIVTSTTGGELGDNRDNNCNGCTDEDLNRYCYVPAPVMCCSWKTLPQRTACGSSACACCNWATPAERTVCLTNHQASITPGAPLGDRTLLPCTSVMQASNPTTWLTIDPGEVCDGIDNNCVGGVDEDTLRCGSPLHCPRSETCNGEDDDCDGTVDNGVCSGGCTPSAEVCNGCDDDCNGLSDDGVAPVPCGSATPANCLGVSACRPAQVVGIGGCTPSGGRQACTTNPTAEVCDGIDNDCNGVMDDGLPLPSCVPSGTPAGLVLDGGARCRPGQLPCNGACTGFVGPIDEVCNGVDDDCDGQTDEAVTDSLGNVAAGLCCPSGARCGVGRCTAGQWACVASSSRLECVGGTGPASETCNGVDDDCNGVVDDVANLGAECQPAPGRLACDADAGVLRCAPAMFCTQGAGGGSAGGTAGGASGGVAGGTAGGTAGGASGGVAGGTAGGTAGGASGGVAGGVAGGTAGGASGGVAGGVAGGTAGGASGGVAGGGSAGGTAGGASGGVAGGMAGGTAGGASGGVAGGASGGTAGGVSGGVAGGTSGGVAGGNAGGAAGGTGTAGGDGGPTPAAGCSCTSSGGTWLLWGVLLPLTRRRRRAAPGKRRPAMPWLAAVLVSLVACTERHGATDSTPAVQRAALTCVDAGCGDTEVDPANCGRCGVACVLANATPGCRGGRCVVSSCQPGFADLDGVPGNGCEAPCAGDGGTERCDGVDNDCDGLVDEGFNLQRDVRRCGSCTNDCTTLVSGSVASCVNGVCAAPVCPVGTWRADAGCIACTPRGAEACNGLDDDCNGLIDDGITAPSPVVVCGVPPEATAPECTTGVSVACVNGAFRCTFPAGVCSGATCAATAEVCDAVDNDCDGKLNENVPSFGKSCASDDLQPGAHGLCRTTGTFACVSPNAVACNAVKADCATLDGGCTEVCDGLDNDCDGVIDEFFLSPGPNASFFVKPAVTRIAANRWIYSYEASRTTATSTSGGPSTGPLPLGVRPVCSGPGRVPWQNVSPAEAEQACGRVGGVLCSTADTQQACQPGSGPACVWAFNPRSSSCTLAASSSRFCNLGPTFDSNLSEPGDQDGVLPTASPLLQNCWADWSNLEGNTAATNRIYDLTGNVREITRSSSSVFPVVGGSYLTEGELGATCTFAFTTFGPNDRSPDTGFRCCFSSNPSP